MDPETETESVERGKTCVFHRWFRDGTGCDVDAGCQTAGICMSEYSIAGHHHKDTQQYTGRATFRTGCRFAGGELSTQPGQQAAARRLGMDVQGPSRSRKRAHRLIFWQRGSSEGRCAELKIASARGADTLNQRTFRAVLMMSSTDQKKPVLFVRR
jgi:hypothetical protein